MRNSIKMRKLGQGLKKSSSILGWIKGESLPKVSNDKQNEAFTVLHNFTEIKISS